MQYIAAGNINPLRPDHNVKLNDAKYWKIEIWAKRKWRFDKPIMILFSFNICEYGKWYKYASGLFSVSNNTKIKITHEKSKINFISFIFNLLLKIKK